jgi:hypothetical protein
MNLPNLIPPTKSFPMSFTVAQLAEVLQTVLTLDAEDAARETGFVQRRRQLTGPLFVQTLVFGWLDNPQAPLEDLAQTAADLGADITPQALDQRLTPQAADCLAAVLDHALGYLLAARPAVVPLLRRFNGVYLQDSTTISLPAALAPFLPGSGGSASVAALKLQVRWELTTCVLEGLSWHPGRAADTRAPLSRAFLPPGALRLTDLGYFDLEALQDYAAQEVYFLSRLTPRVAVYDGQGRKWSLAALLAMQQGDTLDTEVEVGAEARLRCRLLAVRVPEAVAEKRRQRLRKQAQKKGRKVSAERLALCGWTVYITTVPAEKLSLAEALVLRGARWQVELLFKLWKSEGGVDRSQGHKPFRVLCEVYAKLLGLVVQHCLLLTAGPLLGRSATQGARRVRRQALRLAQVLGVRRRLRQVLRRLQRQLERGCGVKNRKGKPSTLQTLLDPDQSSFAHQKTLT